MTTKKKQPNQTAIERVRDALNDAQACGISQAQCVAIVNEVFDAPTMAKRAKTKKSTKPAPATKPAKSVNTLRHADGRVLEFRILNGDALLGSYLEARGANIQRLDRATARQFYRRAIASGFEVCDRDPKAKAAIDAALVSSAAKG